MALVPAPHFENYPYLQTWMLRPGRRKNHVDIHTADEGQSLALRFPGPWLMSFLHRRFLVCGILVGKAGCVRTGLVVGGQTPCDMSLQSDKDRGATSWRKSSGQLPGPRAPLMLGISGPRPASVSDRYSKRSSDWLGFPFAICR